MNTEIPLELFEDLIQVCTWLEDVQKGKVDLSMLARFAKEAESIKLQASEFLPVTGWNGDRPCPCGTTTAFDCEGECGWIGAIDCVGGGV